MKFELSCPGKFIDELDSAAQACGVSRQRFARAVLGAAARGVNEREELRAFQEARATSAAVKWEKPPDNSEGFRLRH